MLHSFNLSKNKSYASLTPKVIVTSLVILMISSGMIILPSYALPSAITIPKTLSAPTGLKATLVSSTSVQLSWNAVPGASSYIIARSATTTGFKQIGISATASYLDKTIASNSCYEVASYSPNVPGHASGAVCISITPTAPLTTTITPPNPACQSVKTILTNSGYSATVIATVMTAMKCS